MSSGLIVRDANGNTRIDLSSRLGRIIYQKVLLPQEAGSINLPGSNSSNCAVFIHMMLTDYANEYNFPWCGHKYWWTGETLNWSKAQDGMLSTAYRSSVIVVIRFK